MAKKVLKKDRRTSEKKPEYASPHFTFNRIQAFVGGLFVHAKCDGDMRGLPKRSVLCGVMALAKMIDTVAAGSMRI